MNGLPLLSVWGMNRLWKILPKSVGRLKKRERAGKSGQKTDESPAGIGIFDRLLVQNEGNGNTKLHGDCAKDNNQVTFHCLFQQKF